jgi:hypothetical protein
MQSVRGMLHTTLSIYGQEVHTLKQDRWRRGVETSNAFWSRRVVAQQKRAAEQILNEIGLRDRQALTRFYGERQPAEQICRDLGITPEEFYQIKSSARSRFQQLCNAHLDKGSTVPSERDHGFDELEA